jgi:hypothetical protein
MSVLEQLQTRPAADFPRGVALLRDPLLNKGTASSSLRSGPRHSSKANRPG